MLRFWTDFLKLLNFLEKIPILKEFEWFEWFEWFGPSPIEPFNTEVISGYYYGSDGLRSPFTMTRDPGTPEYQGEDDPQQATYNNWSPRARDEVKLEGLGFWSFKA